LSLVIDVNFRYKNGVTKARVVVMMCIFFVLAASHLFILFQFSKSISNLIQTLKVRCSQGTVVCQSSLGVTTSPTLLGAVGSEYSSMLVALPSRFTIFSSGIECQNGMVLHPCRRFRLGVSKPDLFELCFNKFDSFDLVSQPHFPS